MATGYLKASIFTAACKSSHGDDNSAASDMTAMSAMGEHFCYRRLRAWRSLRALYCQKVTCQRQVERLSAQLRTFLN